MTDMSEQVKEVCEKYKLPQRHTDFQIEHFIIGKETSLYGKIWQCLRELNQRKENLEAIELELLELDDNLALEHIHLRKLELKKESVDVGRSLASVQERNILKVKKLDVLISKQKRKIQNIQKNIVKTASRKDDVLAEASKFLDIFNRLINEREFVDINDPKAQLEFWTAKFNHEVSLTAALNHPMNAELVKSVLALPDESKIKVQMLNALDNVGKKLQSKNN